ncbi:MAG: ABC transporter ATP-binding protein [Thermoanaerobaculaceae bacterium]
MEGAPAAVVLEKVSKSYPLFPRRRARVGAILGFRTWQPKVALQDLSLTVAVGEALGIIGANGSGKSTLLRLIAGIGRPDTGAIWTKKPVGAILELGLGFHPDFTGRENAQLYVQLLGIPSCDQEEAVDAALAFADLGDFADQPLRVYSSGMAARLAFAVATAIKPAVFIVDEVLAVGDLAFQRKCLERMVALKKAGLTVLFCSHAMYQVAHFCDRVLWLKDGKPEAVGAPGQVIPQYESWVRQVHLPDSRPSQGRRPAWIQRAQVQPARPFSPGEPLALEVVIKRVEDGIPLHLAVEFVAADGETVAAFGTLWDGLPPLAGGKLQEVVLEIPHSPFARGPVDFTVWLGDERGLQVYDGFTSRGGLQVQSASWAPGWVTVEHRWVWR